MHYKEALPMMIDMGGVGNIMLSVHCLLYRRLITAAWRMNSVDVKLGVDGLANLSIIRTSSDADRTKNSLVINELDDSMSEEEVSMKLIESGEKGG
jgi:hypothetical protein